MTVLMRPLVGWALDRLGRRPFFIGGLAGYALTMGVFAVSEQVWGIMVARLLQGVASSLMWLAVNAIVADVSSETGRGQAFGSVDQSSSQGAIVGTFLGFTLLQTEYHMRAAGHQLDLWSPMFAIYASLSLLGVAIALRRLPETRPRQQPGHHRRIPWSRPWALLLLLRAPLSPTSGPSSPK